MNPLLFLLDALAGAVAATAWQRQPEREIDEPGLNLRISPSMPALPAHPAGHLDSPPLLTFLEASPMSDLASHRPEMAALMPVHHEEGQLWADARTLRVGRDFSTWVQGRLAETGAVEGEEFSVLDGSPNSGSKWGGSNRRDYWLSLDLAMLERSEAGKQVRRHFIEAEKRLRSQLVLPDFTDPVVAARAWADAMEAQRAEQAARQAAEQQVAVLSPKAETFDALMSADGSYSVSDAAKLLGTGQRRGGYSRSCVSAASSWTPTATARNTTTCRTRRTSTASTLR
ncbi:antA/AntB antirepressor family protein [Deinococcus hopiensis]|uniref:antA/AntB antirepressor family protein n=1 Tax=Deinococcus hopiensis TaxID=309885 RepID=UPI001FEC0184|nr:antA/AntB antirepressor family protein [Deinococcus hopiensis]